MKQLKTTINRDGIMKTNAASSGRIGSAVEVNTQQQ